MNTLEVYDKQVKEATEAVRQYAASLLTENGELARELEKAREAMRNALRCVIHDAGGGDDTDGVSDEYLVGAATKLVNGLAVMEKALEAEVERLKVQLAEARKQPVVQIPTITAGILAAYNDEFIKPEYDDSEDEIARAWNAVLARHFRPAPAKPAMDVAAVAKEISARYHGSAGGTVREASIHVLSAHVTDVPAKPALDVDVLASAIHHRTGGSYVVIRDTLREHVTVAPAQSQLRPEHFSSGITINGGTVTFEPCATTAAIVERVQRETRRECIDRVRRWSMTGDRMMSTLQSLLNELERGK